MRETLTVAFGGQKEMLCLVCLFHYVWIVCLIDCIGLAFGMWLVKECMLLSFLFASWSRHFDHVDEGWQALCPCRLLLLDTWWLYGMGVICHYEMDF